MSPSARIEGKARRYLAEGRLTVHERAGLKIRAACRGSASEPYHLGHDPDSGWWCDCPASRGCAHIHALRLVAAEPPEAAA